jgi:hypothetical protein
MMRKEVWKEMWKEMQRERKRLLFKGNIRRQTELPISGVLSMS